MRFGQPSPLWQASLVGASRFRVNVTAPIIPAAVSGGSPGGFSPPPARAPGDSGHTASRGLRGLRPGGSPRETPRSPQKPGSPGAKKVVLFPATVLIIHVLLDTLLMEVKKPTPDQPARRGPSPGERKQRRPPLARLDLKTVLECETGRTAVGGWVTSSSGGTCEGQTKPDGAPAPRELDLITTQPECPPRPQYGAHPPASPPSDHAQ